MSLQEITKQRQELGGVISSERLAKSEKVIPVSSKKIEAGLGRRALSAAIHIVGNTAKLATRTPLRRRVVAALAGVAGTGLLVNHFVVQPNNERFEKLKQETAQARTDAEIKAKIATENALSKAANDRLNASDKIPKAWSVTAGGTVLNVPCSTSVSGPNPETGVDGDVSPTGSRPFKYKDTGAQKIVNFDYIKVGVLDANGLEYTAKSEPAAMDLNKEDRLKIFTTMINDAGICQPQTDTNSSSPLTGGGDQAAGVRKP